MKFILVLFAVVFAVTVSSAARVAKVARDTGDERPACDIACTFLYEPVCGWDGAEYKSFGNACLMKKHNCEIEAKGKKFEDSDMDNCPQVWVD